MEALSTEQVEQHAAEIEEKGFSVMENAIPEDFLLEIMAELERRIGHSSCILAKRPSTGVM